MSTPVQLIKKRSHASASDIDWISLLISEWQLIADLTYADLVLWFPDTNGQMFAVGHARPSGSGTIFYRDISGEPLRKEWQQLVTKAFETGEIAEHSNPDNYEGAPSRFSAIPVRRRKSPNQEAVLPDPIAVITRHTNLSETQSPNKSKIAFMTAGNDLLRMVAQGAFPDLGNPTGAKRGAPRANDGLLRLDVDGKVTFASPNGLSGFNKFGVEGELEGKLLAEAVTKVLAKDTTIEESLPLVLTGKAPWRMDIESRNTTLSLRAIPLKAKGERIGALVLSRDVTDFRRAEQELITKDATIREIHHRVKNNLQTVASLLRMQSRRVKSDEAKEALEQSMRRVAAIAMVHDTLAAGITQDVDFDDVCDRVLSLASELAVTQNSTVKTVIDGKFGQLKGEIATHLAIVLTELIGNAVEHGFAGKTGVIHISAERHSKRLEVSVTDNGKGLPQGKTPSGLGTTIIRTLIEGELRGTIKWLSPVDGGTKATISIPL